MRNIATLLICLCSITGVYAQDIVQPKIMVVPYTKEGEDIRTILEKDENKRIVLTKIKEAFDNRGFTTVDFTARLKAAQSADVFNMDNKSDIKTQIINMSGADIYVEAEIICTQTSVSGQTNPEGSVKLIITAYESATGNSLSNKIGESGRFYTRDIGKLAMKAIESCADEFLKTMQTKFSEIAQYGRSVVVNIGFDEDSQYTMESEIGNNGLLLSDEIELWMESIAYNNNYHLQGVSKNMMLFDDVKLPLIDPQTGNNYTLTRFGMEFLRFFRSLGLTISRDVKGSTLYITIK